MSRYPETDLEKIRTYAMRRRRSLVEEERSYRPPTDPASFADFWESLPDVLASRDLRELVERTVRAKKEGRGILLLAGAHVIKTGMTPGLIRLMEDGWVTGLALNGAGAVHDLEMSFFGRTSEDVAEQLPLGRFGMSRETSLWLNQWTGEAWRRKEGLGEGLGRAFLEHAPAGSRPSILGTAYRLGIPATVHLAIGADINHQHPSFSGEAAGGTTARDFRILCHVVAGLARGVALNIGSAVILPEVFLKAVSVATNQGIRFTGLTTAVFDFQRHYRPAENVVRRPNLQGGRGSYLVGHHEILLPVFFQALLWRAAGIVMDGAKESRGRDKGTRDGSRSGRGSRGGLKRSEAGGRANGPVGRGAATRPYGAAGGKLPGRAGRPGAPAETRRGRPRGRG